MKYISYFLLALFIASCSDSGEDQDKNVKDTKQVLDMTDVGTRLSYAWGVTAAGYFQQMATQTLTADQIKIDELIKGVKDSEAGNARFDKNQAQMEVLNLIKAIQSNESITDELATNFCYAQGVIIYNETAAKIQAADVNEDINMEVFYIGIEDALNGRELAIPSNEIDEIMMNLKNDRLDDGINEEGRFDIKDLGGFSELEGKAKVSYALGATAAMNIYSGMYSPQYEMFLPKTKWDAIIEGMRDQISGNTLKVQMEEYQGLAKEFMDYSANPEGISDTLSYKFSYGIGMMVGDGAKKQLSAFGMKTYDVEQFMTAVKEILIDHAAKGDMADIAEYINQYAMEHVQKASEEFLKNNKTKPGVKTTASGLQYKVVSMGTGEKPKPNNTVKVHYHGTLVDGTIFDSSVDRDEPAEFGLSQVIPGWTEGLMLMPVGSKFEFYIPNELAYGIRGQGSVPPYAALVFEVELLEIVK